MVDQQVVLSSHTLLWVGVAAAIAFAVVIGILVWIVLQMKRNNEEKARRKCANILSRFNKALGREISAYQLEYQEPAGWVKVISPNGYFVHVRAFPDMDPYQDGQLVLYVYGIQNFKGCEERMKEFAVNAAHAICLQAHADAPKVPNASRYETRTWLPGVSR